MKESFAKLLDEVFEPSPFGHGGNTVLDQSVRKAMQVRRRLDYCGVATINRCAEGRHTSERSLPVLARMSIGTVIGKENLL